MPYATVLRHYPNTGMNTEMRPLVEEATLALQRAGLDASLSRSTFAADHAWFQIATRWAKLSDREAASEVLANWAAQYGTKTLWMLSRQPPTNSLLELLQTTNAKGTPKWAVTFNSAAAVGKVEQLRSLLLEGGRRMEAAALNTALLQHVAGAAALDLGSFVRVLNFDSLDDFETWRAGTNVGPEYAEKRDTLLGRPLQSAIREVLIPYPDR